MLARMLSDDVASLRQIKVRITDPTERKNIWTTANRTIVEKVGEKGNGNGIVGVRKPPSGRTTKRTGRQGKACTEPAMA